MACGHNVRRHFLDTSKNLRIFQNESWCGRLRQVSSSIKLVWLLKDSSLMLAGLACASYPVKPNRSMILGLIKISGAIG